MIEDFTLKKECDFFIKNISCIYNTYSYMPKTASWVHKKEMKRSSELLIYVMDGEAMLCPGNQKFHVRANDIVFIPSKQQYSSYGIKYPFYYLGIAFEADMYNTSLDIKTHDQNNYFYNKFKEIKRKWTNKDYGFLLETKAMIYSLFAELMREQNLNKYPAGHYSIINKAQKYINTNINNPYFSIDELVSYSEVSDTYFRKIFKDFYGTTPVKYITNLRITNAKELLVSTNMPINKIAEQTGFINLYYFSNTFKSIVGESPLNYRKSHNFVYNNI